MKNKLTLEHLSVYLPYEVKFISEMDKPYDEYGTQPIWTLNGINEMFSEHCLITKESIDAYPISKCKIRLRPLSDLTKEIEHNGEKLVPIDVLGWNSYDHIIKKGMCDNVGYQYMIKLFEWHFDVFGLREKNLCVYYNEI